jgi:hypothetical protein
VSDTPPEPPSGPPPGPPVGPLALEAALLLDVVADRLESMKQRSTTSQDTPDGQRATGADGGAATDGEPGGGPGAAGPSPTVGIDGRCPECGSIPGASCTACPVCRFLALLRGERPEATAKLVDGALMIIRTLRSLVPDQPTAAAAGASTTEPPPPPARRGGLEHIDIL